MKTPRRHFFAASALVAAFALAACAPTTTSSEQSDSATSTQSIVVTDSSQSSNATPASSSSDTSEIDLTSFTGATSPAELMAANADYTVVKTSEWNESDAIALTLNGSTVSGGEDAGVSAADGTVTITQGGVYSLSGSLTGQLKIAAPEDAQVVLILNGVSVTNTQGAAIDVVTADDVAIHLADGTQNTVSDASSYADTVEANAAIHSTADLTISGNGSLSAQGNGNDGIASNDDLVILGGTIDVTAADDALRGKDSVVIAGGTLDLTAKAGDGIKSDHDTDETSGYVLIGGGTVAIAAGDDGIQAQTDLIAVGGSITVAATKDAAKADLNATFAGGTLDVTQAGEGIEAPYITVFDGTVNLNVTDDGINAAGLTDVASEADSGEQFLMEGGTVTIASNGDGVDSNGSITVNGGKLDVNVAQRGGDGPVDANGSITIAEGTTTVNGSAWNESMATQAGGPGGAPAGGSMGR